MCSLLPAPSPYVLELPERQHLREPKQAGAQVPGACGPPLRPSQHPQVPGDLGAVRP